MLKYNNGRPCLNFADGDAPPGGGTPPADKPWYDGAAAEDVGYFQNRGWDKVDAKTAALNAAKAHREAEKLIGAPADKIVRLPNDPADSEAWRQVQLRLGMPKDEKGYDLSPIKHADGSALTAEETAAWAKKSYGLGLRPADALKFVQDEIKGADDSKTASRTELDAAVVKEKTDLKGNWGANFEANMFVAKQAAKALNVDEATVAAMEKSMGYAKVMELFRTIGSKIGEDRFVTSPAAGGTGVMTKDQAVAQKAALMADKTWVKAYLDGDAAKVREMTALNTMIVAQ